MTKSTNIYKSVFIYGPGFFNESKEIFDFDKVKDVYSQENFLLIGDDERSLTTSDFHKLKNKIDHTTRIVINVHGNIDKDGHHLSLLQKEGSTYTSMIFEFLSKMSNNSPLNIHFHSCYGGAASKDIQDLPQGSVLTTHIPDSYSSKTALGNIAISASLSNDFDISPYESFIRNINKNSIETSSITTIINNEKYSFTVLPDLKKLIENPKLELEEISNSYYKFYKDISKNYKKNAPSNIFIKDKELKRKEFTKEEIETFAKNYFIFKSIIADNEFVITLKKSNKISNFLKKYNSEDIFNPLITVIEEGSIENLELLLKNGADPNFPIQNKILPSFLAIDNKLDKLKLLLEYGANPKLLVGRTNLFSLAVSSLKFVEMNLLLEYGADPDQLLFSGSPAIILAAIKGSDYGITSLLKYNVNLNVTFQGYTPLDAAVCSGYKDVVKIFVMYDQGQGEEINLSHYSLDKINEKCPNYLHNLEEVIDEIVNSENLHIKQDIIGEVAHVDL